jgi:Ni/Co efflux regulator RcnB
MNSLKFLKNMLIVLIAVLLIPAGSMFAQQKDGNKTQTTQQQPTKHKKHRKHHKKHKTSKKNTKGSQKNNNSQPPKK